MDPAGAPLPEACARFAVFSDPWERTKSKIYGLLMQPTAEDVADKFRGCAEAARKAVARTA
jgi:hypothetical protein